MRRIRFAAAAAAALLAGTSANAAPLTWMLSGVNFNILGAGSITGSFVHDAMTGTYSDVMLTIAGTPAGSFDGVYDTLGFLGPSVLNATRSVDGPPTPGDPTVGLGFGPLPGTPGSVVPIVASSAGNCVLTPGPGPCAVQVPLNAGNIGTIASSAPVPLPAGLALLLTGLAGIGLAGRRGRTGAPI